MAKNVKVTHKCHPELEKKPSCREIYNLLSNQMRSLKGRFQNCQQILDPNGNAINAFPNQDLLQRPTQGNTNYLPLGAPYILDTQSGTDNRIPILSLYDIGCIGQGPSATCCGRIILHPEGFFGGLPSALFQPYPVGSEFGGNPVYIVQDYFNIDYEEWIQISGYSVNWYYLGDNGASVPRLVSSEWDTGCLSLPGVYRLRVMDACGNMITSDFIINRTTQLLTIPPTTPIPPLNSEAQMQYYLNNGVTVNPTDNPRAYVTPFFDLVTFNPDPGIIYNENVTTQQDIWSTPCSVDVEIFGLNACGPMIVRIYGLGGAGGETLLLSQVAGVNPGGLLDINSRYLFKNMSLTNFVLRISVIDVCNNVIDRILNILDDPPIYYRFPKFDTGNNFQDSSQDWALTIDNYRALSYNFPDLESGATARQAPKTVESPIVEVDGTGTVMAPQVNLQGASMLPDSPVYSRVFPVDVRVPFINYNTADNYTVFAGQGVLPELRTWTIDDNDDSIWQGGQPPTGFDVNIHLAGPISGQYNINFDYICNGTRVPGGFGLPNRTITFPRHHNHAYQSYEKTAQAMASNPNPYSSANAGTLSALLNNPAVNSPGSMWNLAGGNKSLPFARAAKRVLFVHMDILQSFVAASIASPGVYIPLNVIQLELNNANMGPDPDVYLIGFSIAYVNGAVNLYIREYFTTNDGVPVSNVGIANVTASLNNFFNTNITVSYANPNNNLNTEQTPLINALNPNTTGAQGSFGRFLFNQNANYAIGGPPLFNCVSSPLSFQQLFTRMLTAIGFNNAQATALYNAITPASINSLYTTGLGTANNRDEFFRRMLLFYRLLSDGVITFLGGVYSINGVNMNLNPNANPPGNFSYFFNLNVSRADFISNLVTQIVNVLPNLTSHRHFFLHTFTPEELQNPNMHIGIYSATASDTFSTPLYSQVYSMYINGKYTNTVTINPYIVLQRTGTPAQNTVRVNYVPNSPTTVTSNSGYCDGTFYPNGDQIYTVGTSAQATPVTYQLLQDPIPLFLSAIPVDIDPGFWLVQTGPTNFNPAPLANYSVSVMGGFLGAKFNHFYAASITEGPNQPNPRILYTMQEINNVNLDIANEQNVELFPVTLTAVWPYLDAGFNPVIAPGSEEENMLFAIESTFWNIWNFGQGVFPYTNNGPQGRTMFFVQAAVGEELIKFFDMASNPTPNAQRLHASMFITRTMNSNLQSTFDGGATFIQPGQMNIGLAIPGNHVSMDQMIPLRRREILPQGQNMAIRTYAQPDPAIVGYEYSELYRFDQ